MIRTVPLPPEASVPVMSQIPEPRLVLNVTVATPLALVVAVVAGVSVPQVPLAVATENVTVSFATTAPPTPLVTVAVTVEVFIPLPCRTAGVAVSEILFGTAVCVIAALLAPDELPPD